MKIVIIKGGSWLSHLVNCCSACRGWNSCDYRYFNLGFRLLFTKVNKDGKLAEAGES